METNKSNESRDCFLTLTFLAFAGYILLFVCTKL